MNQAQSGTKQGLFSGVASGDLTGLEGRLVTPTSSTSTVGGGAAVQTYTVSAAATDKNVFVLEEGNGNGKVIALRPLYPDRSVNVVLSGTCTAGDAITLKANGYAQRAALASGGDTLLGYATTDGVDGQILTIRVSDTRKRDGYEPVQTLAAAGSTQNNAATITVAPGGWVNVTGSDSTKGVILPASTAGARFTVYNSVAAVTLNVYPPLSGTIQGGSANAAVTIAAKSTALFLCIDGTDWVATEAPAA